MGTLLGARSATDSTGEGRSALMLRTLAENGLSQEDCGEQIKRSCTIHCMDVVQATGVCKDRLIALSSLEFQDFFISSERDLFELRLNHLKVKEFLLLARTVIRHANESVNKLPQVSDKKIHEFLLTLTYVLQEIALLANHTFNALHSEDCTSHYVTSK
uniref:(California timema) hypothetical protein n=1 Tax=Timema californicum TaxID=61474 RepID=A0A7R9PDN5_TIMCA|nr:unnamed protein product [Timema californicum]